MATAQADGFDSPLASLTAIGVKKLTSSCRILQLSPFTLQFLLQLIFSDTFVFVDSLVRRPSPVHRKKERGERFSPPPPPQPAIFRERFSATTSRQ